MAKLKSPFSKQVYERNAKVYRALANQTRLEILNSIKFREATVGELVEMLKLRKANVSQHLALLRHLRLVRTRRSGQNIYYKITDPKIIEPCRILKGLWEKRVLS